MPSSVLTYGKKYELSVKFGKAGLRHAPHEIHLSENRNECVCFVEGEEMTSLGPTVTPGHGINCWLSKFFTCSHRQILLDCWRPLFFQDFPCSLSRYTDKFYLIVGGGCSFRISL